MLDLDPQRTAVSPRDAATVVVVRDGEAGLELFAVKRHQKSGFLAGAVVFPGGKVDAADADADWPSRCSGLSARSLGFADEAPRALSFAVASLRELLEEAALLPVVGDGLDAEGALALRAALRDASTTGTSGAQAFGAALAARAFTLDTRRLHAFGRWITPTAEARRFDTRFYLLERPPAQEGLHDEHETTHSFWASPSELLDRWMRGEIFLAPPTSRTAELLATVTDVAGAIQVAGGQSLDPVCPHLCFEGALTLLTLPGDPLYPESHAAPSDPAAPTRFVLEDGRFVARRAAAHSPSR